MSAAETPDQCSDASLSSYLPLYELGVLKEAEASRFENHLLRCPFCRRELASMQNVFTEVSAQREALQAALTQDGLTFATLQQRWSQDTIHAREKKDLLGAAVEGLTKLLGALTRPRELIPALGVTFAIVLSLILLRFPEPTNPYLPFLSFDKVPYTRSTLRAEVNAEAQRFFEAGMLLYQQGDYAEATQYLKEATEIAPEESQYWFFLGLNLYLDKQAEPAIQALSKAESLSEPAQRNRALWYLAQAYLLAGDRDSSQEILTRLVQQGWEYALEAEQLLQQLQNVAPRQP